MSIKLGQVRELTYECNVPNRGRQKVETTKKIVRIMGVDAIQVFIDFWKVHKNAWGFNSRRSVIYYNMSYKWLSDHSRYLREAPFTEKEIALHQPHLVHRTSQCASWHWNQKKYVSLNEFVQALIESNVCISDIEKQAAVCAPRIMLHPYGPNGGQKTATLIEAENGSEILPLELLWKAHNVQSTWKTNAQDGVGIYRQGIMGGIPSYCIWKKNEGVEILAKENTIFS